MKNKRTKHAENELAALGGKFVVLCNRMVGDLITAPDVEAAMAKFNKKQQAHWSSLFWINSEGLLNRLCRMTLDETREENWTLLDVVEDWNDWGEDEESRAWEDVCFVNRGHPHFKGLREIPKVAKLLKKLENENAQA